MNLHFLIPGDPDQLTGGYIYNRKVISGLTERGYSIKIHNPGNDFPFPGPKSIDACEQIFHSIPHGEPVIIDSLALGPSEKIISKYATSCPMIGLVHLPLFKNPSFTMGDQKSFRIKETKALKKMRAIITVSEHTKQIVEQCGLDTRLIHVIKPQAERSIQKAICPAIPRKMLCVANYTRNKGYTILFEALAGLQSLDWRLDCYGNKNMDGEYTMLLEEIITTRGLESKVNLNGPEPHEKLPDVYLDADIFILPSEYESYPMVLVEALVHGIPIIASRAGGIPELVPSGAGLLFQPASAVSLKQTVKSVMTDHKLYASLCKRASESYSTFRSWDYCTDLFEKILNKTV